MNDSALIGDHGLTSVVRDPGQHSGRAPLLMLLHGYGSHEHDLLALAECVDPRYRTLSVRAPLTLPTGGYAWFSIEFTPVGLVPDFDEGLCSRQRLLALLADGQQRFGNDASDTIVLGFSQGGAMALSLLMCAPRRIGGVAFLSGLWTRQLMPQDEKVLADLAGKPVLQTHGCHDPLLPLSKARRSRDLLSELPIDLLYREYEMGHEINQACRRDLATWLRHRLPPPQGPDPR